MQAIALTTPSQAPPASYNVTPTELAHALIPIDDQVVMAMEMQWGFLPPSSKLTTINARLETVRSKVTYKQAFQRHRCLIPANGYFEWLASTKQPYYLADEAHGLLMFAGLYSKSSQYQGFTILTKNADPAISHIHNRMPVMLGTEFCADWLFATAAQAIELASACPMPPLSIRPVSSRVGNVRNKDKGVIAPAEVHQGELFV